MRRDFGSDERLLTNVVRAGECYFTICVSPPGVLDLEEAKTSRRGYDVYLIYVIQRTDPAGGSNRN